MCLEKSKLSEENVRVHFCSITVSLSLHIDTLELLAHLSMAVIAQVEVIKGYEVVLDVEALQKVEVALETEILKKVEVEKLKFQSMWKCYIKLKCHLKCK